MDPLSVTASCVALASTITKCSYALSVFVRDVRDAHGDLARISAELVSLGGILQLLREDTSRMSRDSLPPRLLAQLNSVLDKCNGVIGEIETLIERHRTYRFGASTYWALGGGKDDMAKLRSNLDAHQSALKMGCDVIHFSFMRDIQQDSRIIREQTSEIPAIRNDTEQIYEIVTEIARLRRRLGARSGPSSNILLHRFLEESTTYAETVIQGSIGSDEGLEAWIETPRGSDRHPETRRRHDSHHFTSSNNEGPVDPFNYVPDTNQVHRRERNPRFRSTGRQPSISATSHGLSDDTLTMTSTFDRSMEAKHKIPRHQRNACIPMERICGYESTKSTSRTTFQGHQTPGLPVFSNTPLGPTSLRDFQNHLRRPDDWHWVTHSHETPTDPSSAYVTPEFSSHRYTAMTRGPPYLARLGFTLRQRQEQRDRETMLLVGIYMPNVPSEQGYDAAARFATTIESVTEALRIANEACDPPPQAPWWTKVAICLLHSDATTVCEFGLGSGGMQLRCDSGSEHCGTVPHMVQDDDEKIYAHLWEYTTTCTKFSWDLKGTLSSPVENDTPLQLIQCQYTRRAGRPIDFSDAQHIEPFVGMLDARSCISIPAGQRVDKYDVLNAYVAAQRSQRGAAPVEGLRSYPKGMRMDMFVSEGYASVPTRVYDFDETIKFKEGRRPFKWNWL